MQNWIVTIIDRFGYLGVALLIAIENIFPPIPSELILTFGGFLTTVSGLKVWGVILFATIGSVAGAVVLYGLGRFLDPVRWEHWLDGKPGKLLHLKKEDIHRAHAWFQKRGRLTVFFCRFIPVVRSLISIPAGMSRMGFGIFLLLTTVGTALWNTALVYLGVFFGASWEVAAGYMNTYSLIGTVCLLVILCVFAILFYRKRIKKNPDK